MFKEDKISKYLEEVSKNSSAAFDIYSRYVPKEEVVIRINTNLYEAFKNSIHGVINDAVSFFKGLGAKTKINSSISYINKNKQTDITLIVNLRGTK